MTVPHRLRVAAAIAPVNARPTVASHQVSQQLAGHDVDVLETSGDWIHVRSADQYTGWVHSGFLQPVPEGEHEPRLISLGCVVESADAQQRSLPLRAILRADERVISGEAVPADELPRRFLLKSTQVAASARDLFRGTSYQWGGVTPWGADCSGLVQSTFALHGRLLPRDAWQQAKLGEQLASNFADLRPADLLFFSDRPDRRVTHVGVALGQGEIVHLALGRGGYAREMLDADDPYVAGLRDRFICARRMI